MGDPNFPSRLGTSVYPLRNNFLWPFVNEPFGTERCASPSAGADWERHQWNRNKTLALLIPIVVLGAHIMTASTEIFAAEFLMATDWLRVSERGALCVEKCCCFFHSCVASNNTCFLSVMMSHIIRTRATVCRGQKRRKTRRTIFCFSLGGQKIECKTQEEEGIWDQHFALLSLYYYFSKPGSCTGIIIIIMVIKASPRPRQRRCSWLEHRPWIGWCW